MYYANTNQKKARVFILISDKERFRAKNITWVSEGHFIMIKGSVHQEDIILNV